MAKCRRTEISKSSAWPSLLIKITVHALFIFLKHPLIVQSILVSLKLFWTAETTPSLALEALSTPWRTCRVSWCCLVCLLVTAYLRVSWTGNTWRLHIGLHQPITSLCAPLLLNDDKLQLVRFELRYVHLGYDLSDVLSWMLPYRQYGVRHFLCMRCNMLQYGVRRSAWSSRDLLALQWLFSPSLDASPANQTPQLVW